MHIRASNSDLVEPLPELERTLNRRLRRQNRRVTYDQRNNPPQHPRIVYPPILNINYFCHFLDILQNYDPIDDEPIWAANLVVAPTPGSAITIPKTANHNLKVLRFENGFKIDFEINRKVNMRKVKVIRQRIKGYDAKLGKKERFEGQDKEFTPPHRRNTSSRPRTFSFQL
ncbi:hypothetical protein Tco_1162061 [Tanacetum coccineum]